MAELATAGSVVGLISLSIQSCQGLTSYYSIWKSYDEEIRQTYQSVEDLRIICENLEHELQRIPQVQEPAAQQVVRLIVSCQDGIQSLRHALDRCHSTQVSHSFAERIELYRARALYPFRKQTLQILKDTVQSIQGNLGSALQILQIHLSAGHVQRLSSLARTASSTETTVFNNQSAIQALSLPLQNLSQAFPLMKQQTESTAITVKAVHDETHDLRQDARNFQENMLQELTNLTNRAESSANSLEMVITRAISSYSAEMNQLQRDLQFSQSQDTGDVAAKLEAINQSIKGLQLGLISKPSLMQSVCEEKRRSEHSLTSGKAGEWNARRLRDDRLITRYRCSCKLKPRSFRFGLSSKYKWKLVFETKATSHHRTCPLFLISTSTATTTLRVASCGTFLAGAVEASISIIRGAGGFSISPVLRSAHVVPRDSPAFALIKRHAPKESRILRSKRKLDELLDADIHEIELLFRAGKASPYDVDLEGNTLLHVACDSWLYSVLTGSYFLESSSYESFVWFIKRLIDLCVPLNWANDYTQTFMNNFVREFPEHIDLSILLTSITRLLDIGAEFAKFSSEEYRDDSFLMLRYASSAEFVDALGENELSVAVLHQSEQELAEALQKWPQLINHANGLGQSPLHMAVGWPYGVRTLLKYGARLDSTDHDGYTPLHYAISLGFSETVGIQMKADCTLDVSHFFEPRSFLWHVGDCWANGDLKTWSVSQEAQLDVLDTAISSLAERRRNLQGRLADLPMAAGINAGVFQYDRILDEHAESAELSEKDALKIYGHMPIQKSTLLLDCQTVYHMGNLGVTMAEKLWQHGFRDIDVPGKDGRTPLMLSRGYRAAVNIDMVTEIKVCFWLIQKGAKLHRPQHSPLYHGSDRTRDHLELPPATRALHYVAANIGWRGIFQTKWQNHLGELSTDARLLLKTIFSDVSCDDCICACSSQGCLASTMMLKSFLSIKLRFCRRGTTRGWSLKAIKSLLYFMGPQDSCYDWLVKEIIRFRTFHELELRHTCCRWTRWKPMTKLDFDEIVEITEEDHEKIELLETLLQEFEAKRGDQELLSFFKGYWSTRMDQVLQEQEGRVNEETLREIGVTIHRDETEKFDGKERLEDVDSDSVSDNSISIL